MDCLLEIVALIFRGMFHLVRRTTLRDENRPPALFCSGFRLLQIGVPIQPRRPRIALPGCPCHDLPAFERGPGSRWIVLQHGEEASNEVHPRVRGGLGPAGEDRDVRVPGPARAGQGPPGVGHRQWHARATEAGEAPAGRVM